MSTQVAAVADRAAAERARRAEDRARGQRVTNLGLTPCPYCGGVNVDRLRPTDVDPAVSDATLACQCEVRRAELLAKMSRLQYRYGTGHIDDVHDRVVPS